MFLLSDDQTRTDRIKRWVFNTIASGLPSDHDLEPLRKIVLLNLIILLGSIFLAFLGTIALVQHDYLLGLADLVILLLLQGLFIYLRKTKNYDIVGFVGTVTIGTFYLFLVAYGGVGRTAYMWSFTYPLITLFLLGTKKGTWCSLLLLGLICMGFFSGAGIPFIASYDINLIVRFIPAYLTIYLFAFVMVRVREVVQSRLKTTNLELEEALNVLQVKTEELSASNQELQFEIAQRKHIEKALRKNEGFLDDVIESIQDGISVLNPDLTIRHTNRIMKKWYRENLPLVGKKCYECYHNAKEPCDRCPTLRTLNSGQAERDTLPGLPGSAVEWLEIYCFPIKDNDTGEVTGVVEFVRDVTDHKNMERQLAQAERMDSIGRLAGGVAHDFNNILMGIQGRASLMILDTDADDPSFEHLKGIEAYVKNASELTGQLLGFARGGKYEAKATNLNKLINDTLVMFSRTKKELRVDNTLQQDLWPAEVDRGQLSQVFLNLFVNAWEAMPSGGELSVRTENIYLDRNSIELNGLPEGKYVKIDVIDTGIGIAEKTQSRIFDPFFTTKGLGKGTGLGLASTYGILKNHKGLITVDSCPGSGTTFTIYLPASEKSVEEEKKSGSKISNGSETVLLVDDEEMIVDVGSQLLKRLGYNVLTANNGKEALELYTTRQDEIGCIILDMIMPDQHGGETYDRLKQENEHIKVLLSSGYSMDGQASEILKRGCNGFIQKPFTMEKLSGKLREVLDGR